MNGKFKKASALFAGVALLTGTALAMLAAPASASTATGCESECYTGLPTDGSGLAPGPTTFTDGPYSLGLSFTVADQGVVEAVCYPGDAGEAGDNVYLSNGSTTIGPVASVFLGGGQYCGFLDHAIPAGTWMGYYSAQHDYYQTTGGGTGTSGDITMNGGYYAGGSGGAFPTAGAGAYNFGINVYFQSNPPPPDVSLVQTGLAQVTATFKGDGVAPATATCTSSGAGALGTFSTSPVVLTVPNLATQTVTCTVTESVTSYFTLTGTSSASVTLTGHSGPGCVGTVAAPTQLSAASMAFPGAVVSWAPATASPAGCLAGYLVTPTSGSTALTPTFVPGSVTTTHILGLTEGSSYTFTVAAVTGSGAGPASAATPKITIGAPAAVTALKAAKVGKGAIKVSFKAGAGNGAAITGFVATCGSRSTLGKASPLTVKGLTSGKSYTCTVRAANSRGTGAVARSAAVKA
jgi:Fibronectin type III domain